jgi:hypothetical protein
MTAGGESNHIVIPRLTQIRYGDWQPYCCSDAQVLTRKRERPTTLRWHHKILRTRISPNGILTEASSHERESLP